MDDNDIERIIQNQIAIFNLLASLAEKLTGEKPIVRIKQVDGSIVNDISDSCSVQWNPEKK